MTASSDFLNFLTDDLDALVNEIREIYSVRQGLLRTETSIQLRIRAMRRRFGVSNAPKATPEERRRFREAEWLEKMLLWERNPKRRKPPARPSTVAPDGRDQDVLEPPRATVSPIPPGQDDVGGQLASDSLDIDAPHIAGRHSQAAALISAYGVGYEVALAVHYTSVLVDMREQLHGYRMDGYDKPLIELAKQLPVYPWALECKGLAAISLAQIVGEAGNLSHYPNPAKLWKRMGLAVMPDGQRQRRVTGDEAIAHGYSPSRRSVIFVVGDNLKRSKNETYAAIYAERKEYEQLKDPDARPLALHFRAHRYMEKRFLRDLWRAWRETDEPVFIASYRDYADVRIQPLMAAVSDD